MQEITNFIKKRKKLKQKLHKFKDVFGLQKLKSKLTEIYEDSIKFDFLYRQIKIKLPKSIIKRYIIIWV